MANAVPLNPILEVDDEEPGQFPYQVVLLTCLSIWALLLYRGIRAVFSGREGEKRYSNTNSACGIRQWWPLVSLALFTSASTVFSDGR